MAECPCCNTEIEIDEVLRANRIPGDWKYYTCPVCNAHLKVYLKIDRVVVVEEEEEEE